jgi:signal transduction histidine kinase
MVLSSLKGEPAVFQVFVDQAREILEADFVRLSLLSRIDGAPRSTYVTSGSEPPQGAIPSDILEKGTARLLSRASGPNEVSVPQENLLMADVDFPDTKGVLLCWKQDGRFGPLDSGIARLLCARLGFVAPITTHVNALRRERDRSECLRRIAVRIAGVSSVVEALRIVGEELAAAIPAERFLWAVRGKGDEVWLSEVYARSGLASKDARLFKVPQMEHAHSVLGDDRGGPRLLCKRLRDSGVRNHESEETRQLQRSCRFAEMPRGHSMTEAAQQMLVDAGFIRAEGGSLAIAPVVLSESSWGLILACGADGVVFSADDTCFMCSAASTVGNVWQAADAASALRRFEAAGETVSDLAHDLRYPLTRITEHLRSLRDCDTSKAGDGSRLGSIENEVQRLTALAQELTEVSNPGNRRAEIINLEEFAAYLVSLTSSDLASRSITVKNDVGSVPPAFADRRDFTKIALGILANSADAVKENGTITISSRVLDSERGGKLVGLVFEDSGPGVAKSEIDKVFDAFYTTKEGGCGLGLFSAKKRAKANGGDIVCEMGVDGKSRFVAMFQVAAG